MYASAVSHGPLVLLLRLLLLASNAQIHATEQHVIIGATTATILVLSWNPIMDVIVTPVPLVLLSLLQLRTLFIARMGAWETTTATTGIRTVIIATTWKIINFAIVTVALVVSSMIILRLFQR